MEQKAYEKSRAAPRHETLLEEEASLDEVAEIYACLFFMCVQVRIGLDKVDHERNS